MPISLVIADDHPLILDALSRLFHLEKDFRIAASCTTGQETFNALHQHNPDILVLDIKMPGISGLDVLRVVKKDQLSTRVVVYTAAINDDQVAEAVRLGIRGLVLKEMPPNLLVQAIRKVHAGELWLEKQLVSNVLEKMLREESFQHEATRLLTLRELDIAKLTAEGLRNGEIARKLFISEGTVKIHLHNIYEKLSINSRGQLMRFFQSKKLP